MRNKHKIADQNQTHTVMEVTDPISGETHIVAVDTVDYYKWIQGTHVQDAFPYLDKSRREILITGIGPVSWKSHIEGRRHEGEVDE